MSNRRTIDLHRQRFFEERQHNWMGETGTFGSAGNKPELLR